MYAIISAGGKQHRVTQGERLKIDLVAGKKQGDELLFEVMLLKNDSGYQVGHPLVAGASVKAKVVKNGEDGEGEKDKKILVFKRKRRKQFRKMRGHRQRFTEVQIESISG